MTIELSLITRAKQGDKDAFANLYRQWVGKIYAYCLVRLGVKADAEDVTSKVFMKAMNGLVQFREESSFATWLYAITRNELLDWYRAKRWKPEALTWDPVAAEPDENEDNNQAIQVANTILDTLPKKYAQVLRLRFLQNMSVANTAKVMDETESNVKVLTYRALVKAREMRLYENGK